MTTVAPTSGRSAYLTLPFVGSAHALRWPATHGWDVNIDRETGSATLWLGRWEVHADVTRPGLIMGPAVATLASGAMLAALLRRH